MQKRWKIRPTPEQEAITLRKSLRISYTLCKILVQRGINTYEKARDFFRPNIDHLHSPWLMKDMDKAVQRILKAVSSKEPIMVFGDYDVDGTTSVACMYRFLKQFHTEVCFYVPDRYKEGYGVSKKGIDLAAEKGIPLIIALDCGIKSVELVAYAKKLGIDFIICDHHLPDEILPDAAAILNPKQRGCEYPYKELPGCGVGFKLISALAEKLGLPRENTWQFLDLVAISIAADIVPLTGENRVLATLGLERVNKSPCAGVKAILELAGIKEPLSISGLVYVIAPRINAAGRMGDAARAIRLFIEEDPKLAAELASVLQADNVDRKEADATITEEALEMIRSSEEMLTRKSTVVFKPHWHKGVVGIVASRLIEHYYRPTIVLTQSGDLVAGSARSISGFNLYEAIHACKDHLLGYGGHYAAAGMTLKPESVEAFSLAFENEVRRTVPDELFIPEILIDSEINFEEITPTFFNIIKQMEPFGPENPKPTFLARNVIDTGASKVVKENHLRIVLKQGNNCLAGIGFNLAPRYEILAGGRPADILFTLEENVWNGNRSIQIRLIDIRPAEQS